jgi:DNA helicase-2/ATP-dependent DNA helicase PcrA
MEYSEFKSKFHIILNEQQETAVQKVQGPVLLLAVPGSGKTTVLITRLGYLVYCRSVRPEEILTMTYTVAATRDMRERFCSVFGEEYRDRLEFRTINGVSSRIIQYYERAKERKAFRLEERSAEISHLLGDIYRAQTSEIPTESDIKNIQTQITYIKNMRLTVKEIDQMKSGGDYEIAPIYHEYCRVMRETKRMDYDDQMVYAYSILKRYPDILDYFQRKYRYLCVDEAQDTSKIQHLLIRQLSGSQPNLFMVGDEDQSIYGFRAAYPQALMEFSHVYPEASVLLMETNYRSTPQIVQAADRFILQNKNRYPKNMKASRKSGQPVRQILVYDRKAQYRYLAKFAQNCDRETAVLFRDNDSALPIIDLLDRQGIPYRCRQADSTFFTSRIVRDITDFIRFAADPADSELFLRLYYKFNAGITKAQAQAAVRLAAARHSTVLEELLSLDLSRWSRPKVKALQSHFSHLAGRPAEQAVYCVVNYMGYGDYLDQREADRRKIPILETIAAQVQTPAQLLERLNELRKLVKSGASDPKSPIVLSTIHSSKGLEYDRVVLADVIDGILPQSDPDAEDVDAADLLEEERRLFYVALTRAKNEAALVRFRKEDLKSSFAEFLFPPQSCGTALPSASANYHANSRMTASSFDRYSSGPRENLTAAAKEYFINTRIRHKVFGNGVIIARSGDVATIRFGDGSVKQIDLITALRVKAISILL